MTAKKIKSVNLPKDKHHSYLTRASELYSSMQSNALAQHWNAAVIDAVQCAISANDALLVGLFGIRSIGKSHNDAVDLLTQKLDKSQIGQNANRLSRLLSLKSHVEYGPSLITEKEAKKVLLDAERFFNWIKQTLK